MKLSKMAGDVKDMEEARYPKEVNEVERYYK